MGPDIAFPGEDHQYPAYLSGTVGNGPRETPEASIHNSAGMRGGRVEFEKSVDVRNTEIFFEA